MAKQVIIAALEEVLGEYILNVDKDKMKVQALRGTIKLENVQLDGDLMGAIVLGSLGLSGFGILSCTARSVKISVPLKNLEKEPTKMDMTGVHLLCVPLLPSTAHKMYGAGTTVDPRCSLRTRSKRSKLARFERLFMQGNIPGEGPPAKRVLRAVRELEREFDRRRKSKKKFAHQDSTISTHDGDSSFFSSLDEDMGDMSFTTDSGETTDERGLRDEDIPELPRDWKVKLREKTLRNLEATMHKVHVRCEVSEGGLEFNHPDFRKSWSWSRDRQSAAGLTADQRAFSFGATLEKFTFRTANENWEPGSHEKTSETSCKNHLGPNEYDAKNNKILTFDNLSMYWDDDPSYLLSESPLLTMKHDTMSPDKVQAKIIAVMEAMFDQQDPGTKLRESMEMVAKKHADRGTHTSMETRPHQYVFKDFKYTMHQRLSNRMKPGPISCLFDILDFHWDLSFRPHQFVQYQQLKTAMHSQQRFDTMLRQRPSLGPSQDPRGWWKYVIGCVTTRPNARSWNDVQLIARSRNRYVDLVLKKMSRRSNEGCGFHAGLSDKESDELLALEDLLPIEALSAFHLIALRRFVVSDDEQSDEINSRRSSTRSQSPARTMKMGRSITKLFRGHRSKSQPRSRTSGDASFKPIESPSRSVGIDEKLKTEMDENLSEPTSAPIATRSSLIEVMKDRLARKKWFTNWRIVNARVSISLLSTDDIPIIRFDGETVGSVRSFGPEKRDFSFDINKFEIVDCKSLRHSRRSGQILVVKAEEELDADDETDMTAILGAQSSHDLDSLLGYMDLPGSGTVCRLIAAKDISSLRFSFSSHPATLVWTKPCFDAVAEFFGAPTSVLQTDLTNHLRTAATPLARQTQLALLKPASLTLHINVAAPKIWVPFASSRGRDGALYLDAGHFKMSGDKEDSESNAQWKFDARDISINYATKSFAYFDGILSPRMFNSLSTRNIFNTIVQPFHVGVSGGVQAWREGVSLAAGKKSSYSGPVSYLDVRVSPICLDLVDAEVLARSFGRLYAQGISRVQSRIRPHSAQNLSGDTVHHGHQVTNRKMDSLMRNMTVVVEKVEIAIEGGHVSMVDTADDKSVASTETSVLDFSQPKRAYVVEIFSVRMQSASFNEMKSWNFFVSDASIVQLKDFREYTPLKARHEAKELQYRILERNKLVNATRHPLSFDKQRVSSSDEKGSSDILTASIFQDGVNHVDELEIEVDSLILRVTPTSMKDCAKAIRKIAELVQLVMEDLERKVHEEGRRARNGLRDPYKDFDDCNSVVSRPLSPAFSLVSEFSDVSRTENVAKVPSDSTFLMKVTLCESTVMVGRPAASQEQSPGSGFKSRKLRYGKQAVDFAVVHILSDALVMFQSVENEDGSGSKTLHVSMDKFSAMVDTDFKKTLSSKLSPMIGPTGAEFRIVYATENLGSVVSQDVSMDCEHIKSQLTPNDMTVLVSITRTMVDRLRAGQLDEFDRKRRRGGISRSLFKTRGAAIATSIRIEIHAVSFVVLKAFRSRYGAPEFLSLNVRDFKTNLEGCVSALSGEVSAIVSVDFLNSDSKEWEYSVEPFPVLLSVEQMPDEVVMDFSSPEPITANLTGIFLRDFAEMDFNLLRMKPGEEQNEALTSVLPTVGLRAATESHQVIVENKLGVDIIIELDDSPHAAKTKGVRFEAVGLGLVKTDSAVALDALFDLNRPDVAAVGLRLRLAPSSQGEVGIREPIGKLKVSSTTESSTAMYLLKPALDHVSGDAEPTRVHPARASPETVETSWTDTSKADYLYYLAEPVVEWCMENQRLRSSTQDLYSIAKGRDLLSATLWSPEEEYTTETIDLSLFQGAGAPVEDSSADNGRNQRNALSPSRRAPYAAHRSNWLRPYLKNDSPEWSDMTCILNMARERVMLPDSNWVWANDWAVDVSGELGETTDSDGWEYQADFETFTRNRRYYKKGDTCRRRRWTRTRIVKPPALEDPHRLLRVVWHTSRDEAGNYRCKIQSNLSVVNRTGAFLSVFVTSPGWNVTKHAGSADRGETLCVPVHLAPAVYLQIAKPRSKIPTEDPNDHILSERLLILPTGHDSCNFIRTSIELDDISATTLHFLVKVQSEKGIVTVTLLPVLRVLNLLPCELECQLGEVLRPSDRRTPDSRKSVSGSSTARIANVETLQISTGEEGEITALNPASRPHISLRVPGYRWSSWQPVVNRKSNSETWRPHPQYEDIYLNSNKSETDNDDEFKSIVRFERLADGGDPLVLIVSVECGHCPRVRIYSQYWIVDKTGFGCRYCDSLTSMIGSNPDVELSRRSFLNDRDSQNGDIQQDMSMVGYQWSMGHRGMTLFFSPRDKFCLCVETLRPGEYSGVENAIRTKWTSPMDVSNVMPKTVFSVDEVGGSRRFEFALCVTICPGAYSRTKLISIIPRYNIVNLLKRELIVAQSDSLHSECLIPPQTAVPHHWEEQSLPPKIRLGAPSLDQRVTRDYNDCWTIGSIQLDKIGITSMRLPTSSLLPTHPMVAQAEVRLSAKDEPSAVTIVIWSANEEQNPLYVLRNISNHTILCRQPLKGDAVVQDESEFLFGGCTGSSLATKPASKTQDYKCGPEFDPILRSVLGLSDKDGFIWTVKPGESMCFGFDDPEGLHLLEWACSRPDQYSFAEDPTKAFVEVDAMGSLSVLTQELSGEDVWCQIKAEHSTKVIEFSKRRGQLSNEDGLERRGIMRKVAHFPLEDDDGIADDEDEFSLTLRLEVPSVTLSVIDNVDRSKHGREILVVSLENMSFSFCQSREGYHEVELQLMSLQVDNHVPSSVHPVLVFFHQTVEKEPVLHLSAVRRLQAHHETYVFRYAALRILALDVFLDRRTAEAIALFIKPFRVQRESRLSEGSDWLQKLTLEMNEKDALKPDRELSRQIEKLVQSANSGRMYFEQLHLHPIRLAFTFSQEWVDAGSEGTEGLMVFHFIRGMASVADAPLTFTSFVVGHVFEAPQTLVRVIATHYSSQLTKQIFGILGSLAILHAPADFISNVGTGVRDFFYEPINGAVHGPRQFIEGLEAGTQSLARGVFVGVVRGAANVTEILNHNLAGLTADDDFIDERRAHQRMITDAMSRGITSRAFSESLVLAGASVGRGLRSGALGVVQQPAKYASKHGPVGLVKGIGKALVGAIVKPVVGVGDAAALLMNHVSDAASSKEIRPKIPKRLRRAFPVVSTERPNCVIMRSYDDRAAKAQKIVTGGESVDDVYIGHVNIPGHLVIASYQCLWAIDKRSREPWCIAWEEISHYNVVDGGIQVVVFSQNGLRPFLFEIEDRSERENLNRLLSMQSRKMGNIASNMGLEMALHNVPGVKRTQSKHIFGSSNNKRVPLSSSVRDEIDLIEQSFSRINKLGSDSVLYFETLDNEAWGLVSCWGQVYSGLSSRRCVAAGIINGTDIPIQIKSTKLIEGGSPCYSLPTSEFDSQEGILNAGGAIVFFGWGVAPTLLQPGNVFMNIETNAFIADFSDRRSRDTHAEALPGYRVSFLEKSYDDLGWWAKFWLLIQKV